MNQTIEIYQENSNLPVLQFTNNSNEPMFEFDHFKLAAVDILQVMNRSSHCKFKLVYREWI